MAGRYRTRQTSRTVTDSKKSQIISEEPAFVLSGRSPQEIYCLTLLDSANLKRSITRRLSQLNYLVRYRRSAASLETHGLTFDYFIRFVSVSLCDSCKEIRAAAFRVVRHFTVNTDHCHQLQVAHIDFYLARALDLSLDNEAERIQAILLIRKLVQLTSIPGSVISALAAIAVDGTEERERMTRICLEIMCEIVILCPNHPNIVTVIRVLMDFLLESNSTPLTTAVVVALTRISVRAQQYALPARFCDITRVLHPVTSFEGLGDSSRHEARFNRSVMIQSSKSAIVATLRTWEGLYLLSASNSGLSSLFGVLFLSNQQAQEAVLDIITLSLFLSDDCDTTSSKPACDSWSLQENFVADEARALLVHIGRTRINLCTNYLALLLFIFYQNGLIDGLVHVISGEGKCYLRAFNILCSVLALAKIYLPAEFIAQMQSFSSLVSLATNSSQIGSRIHGFNTLADLLKQSTDQEFVQCGGAKNASIYLQHLLALNHPSNSGRHDTIRDTEISAVLREALSSMTHQEYPVWKWSSISSVLKAKILHKDDPLSYKFLHRLLFFYKPSNRLFSGVLKKNESAINLTGCGRMFIDVILREACDLLEDFLSDLQRCLRAVKEAPNDDVIFNPLKLFSTCAADYFIFIGQISSSLFGQSLLTSHNIYPLFFHFVSDADIHESYVKLIVTTLDYRLIGDHSQNRTLFEKVIMSSSSALRCYATFHLRTLLRVRMRGFCEWAMTLLISLISDPNAVVARAAMEIIDEACDEMANLKVLVRARPYLMLDHFAPMGDFLTARILGTVEGFEQSPTLAVSQVEKWRTTGNHTYLTFVEQSLNSKMLISDLSDGVFYRHSTSHSDNFLPELFLPEHLYGQLCRHADGCDLIRPLVSDLVATLKMSPEHPVLDMKAALWALGHIGRTTEGMVMLNELDVLDVVIDLVTTHPNVSVRGTAFFVIGLWSTTERGADLLKSRDWLSVRHDRHECWPLVDQRVQYTWNDTSHVSHLITLTHPVTHIQGRFSNLRKSRILSHTTLPAAQVRSPSPKIPAEQPERFFGPTAACQVMPDGGRPKSSRGESGFESSDSGLIDSLSAGCAVTGMDETRAGRSESSKTQTSDFSVGSLDSVDQAVHDAPEVRHGNTDHRRKLPAASSLSRSKSGLYGSIDGVLNRTRRSETRHSFRDLTTSIKHVVLKRHSNHIQPVTPLIGVQSQSSDEMASSLGETSAKEEKFMGISLPVRRNIWLYHTTAVSQSASSALVQDNVPCLHGAKAKGNLVSETGLDIHTVEKCIVCSVTKQDLSLIGDGDGHIVLRRREVLNFVWILASPLGHKAAEQGILQLKNQLPECFSDACLYTEVCHLLASFTYKLSIRRLIQELFLDVSIQKRLQPYLEKEISMGERLLDCSLPEDGD